MTHHPHQFPIRSGIHTGSDRPGRRCLSGQGTYSLGSRERQGAAGGEPPRSTGWGGIFTTAYPLTNAERIAAWRWRQRLKPARATKRPDRLSGWEIFGDLVALAAFLVVLVVGVAAAWALQSVSDSNAAEERCFSGAVTEWDYCRSQADWGAP